MRALVTGGAGFIGSHLCQYLLDRGYDVVLLDDLSTGSADNIAEFRQREGFEFVYDTVRNEQCVHVLVDRCEVIYHLAAAVGVQLIVDFPVRTIETNIHGSEVVLQIANKFGRRIFIASTSEVYGKSEKMPFCEDDDSVLGSTRFSRWSYACSKAIDEFLGLAYYQQYGLEAVIGRLFNTVGPRQTGQYGMVVPKCVRRALLGGPLEIYGDGGQSRCFGHVSDVVRAIVDLMEHPDPAGRVYNIGSDQEISIEALADKIIAKTGSKSKKVFVPYEQAYGRPFDDMRRRMPSLERINKLIGYKPEKTLDDILDSVIEYYRAKLDL